MANLLDMYKELFSKQLAQDAVDSVSSSGKIGPGNSSFKLSPKDILEKFNTNINAETSMFNTAPTTAAEYAELFKNEPIITKGLPVPTQAEKGFQLAGESFGGSTTKYVPPKQLPTVVEKQLPQVIETSFRPIAEESPSLFTKLSNAVGELATKFPKTATALRIAGSTPVQAALATGLIPGTTDSVGEGSDVPVGPALSSKDWEKETKKAKEEYKNRPKTYFTDGTFDFDKFALDNPKATLERKAEALEKLNKNNELLSNSLLEQRQKEIEDKKAEVSRYNLAAQKAGLPTLETFTPPERPTPLAPPEPKVSTETPTPLLAFVEQFKQNKNEAKLNNETPSVETQNRKVASTPVESPTKQPEIKEAVAPVKPFEDTEMEEALNQQRLTNTLATIGKISSKIGSAIAGTTLDNSNFDAISKLGAQGVQDIATKRKAKEELLDLQTKTALSDPTSDESKKRVSMAQAYLNSSGLTELAKKIEGLSGAEIDKKFPIISKIVEGKENREARKEEHAILRETRDAARQEQKETKDEARIQDWLERTLKTEMNSDVVKRLERVQQDSANIDKALTNPNGIADIAVLYGFIKSIDDTSAVKEGELKLTLEAMNALQRIKTATSNYTSKKRTLDDNLLKDIKTVNESAKKAAQKSYDKRIKLVYNQGLDRGIPKERLERSIGLFTQQPEEKQNLDAVEYTKRNPNVSYEQAVNILNHRKTKLGIK